MEEEEEEVLVVVVGGSGYLGLHLLQTLACYRRLAFTYFSHPPPPALLLHARPFQVDLRSGQGFHSISTLMGPPQVVINCAAISIPRECESDPTSVTAINVPSTLLDWLSSLAATDPPLLIHLSTDQVYEGTKSFYKEEDETKPVNAYGRSKLEAEQFIMKSWPNYAILRSSIIYGPEPIVQVQKSLPIQWIENVLSNGKGAEFFDDEFRCPVFVKDLVKVVELLLRKQEEGVRLQLLLNIGGPERLSRAEMAEVVADVRGFDKALVKRIPAASVCSPPLPTILYIGIVAKLKGLILQVNRGVVSPADISMNVNRCTSMLNITLTPFRKGVELTFTNDP